MPGINFNYTKFLREQNEKYIKKYGDEPIKADLNPQPLVGFSGHVPYYRGSIHELRVVRSLVRCINSPMKPTTATGYRTKSRQFYHPGDDEQPPTPPSTSSKAKEIKKSSPKASETQPISRIRSAPAALSRERLENSLDGPKPSHISMMAAGSSARLKRGRPQTTASPRRNTDATAAQTARQEGTSPRSSVSRSSTGSLAPIRLPTPLVIPNHPTGYPQTLYGSSYWYAWGGDASRTKDSKPIQRRDSFDRDRRLTGNDGVLYHKHEGMVPKYLGYVPGYKFRHGSTFGVLTVNATSQGLAHKMTTKG